MEAIKAMYLMDLENQIKNLNKNLDNNQEDFVMINLTISKVLEQLKKGKIEVAEQMLLHIQSKINN